MSCATGNRPSLKTEDVLRVVHRAYPDAANVYIAQYFMPVLGWLDANDARVSELPRLAEWGATAVQLRLVDRNNISRCPDYQIAEFVAAKPSWKIGDVFHVDANQGMRLAEVMAVIGDEALIEYEMPSGGCVLWVIHRESGNKIRNVSYRRLPAKWRKAVEEADKQLSGTPLFP